MLSDIRWAKIMKKDTYSAIIDDIDSLIQLLKILVVLSIIKGDNDLLEAAEQAADTLEDIPGEGGGVGAEVEQLVVLQIKGDTTNNL